MLFCNKCLSYDIQYVYDHYTKTVTCYFAVLELSNIYVTRSIRHKNADFLILILFRTKLLVTKQRTLYKLYTCKIQLFLAANFLSNNLCFLATSNYMTSENKK